MIKYLVVLLDDASPSFCHYTHTRDKRNLISLDLLKDAVFYAMRENLVIQYVYPGYDLPEGYSDVIGEMTHVNIVPLKSGLHADAVVIEGFDELNDSANVLRAGVPYVLRTDHKTFMKEWKSLTSRLEIISRLNIVYTDLCDFRDEDSEKYAEALNGFSEVLKTLASKGKYPQVNILTDRMLLGRMNNCNAGVESITLAPDGRFYVCPGFYYDGLGSVGSPADGLCIKNPHLYELEYAPICRICDSYHCKRCVWMNRKTTLEVNTPSHEQCVMSHIERNASRAFVLSLKDDRMSDEIPEIDYLDPFDELIKNR